MSEAMVSRRRHNRRKVRNNSSLPGRMVAALAVVLSFSVVAYVLAVTVVLPRIRISRVIVQADFGMDRADILELAGLDGEANYFSIRPAEMARRIESHPEIRSAEVVRTFPDVVTLRLDRRRPLLASFVSVENKTELALIDETGSVFLTGAEAARHDVPLISGITFRGKVLGSTLPESMKPLLKGLYELRIASPEIFALISEVRLDALRAGDFEVLLYLQGFRIPVRMFGEIDARTCTYALMVLDVLVSKGIGAEVKELDFRSGEIVYRMKEAVDADE